VVSQDATITYEYGEGSVYQKVTEALTAGDYAFNISLPGGSNNINYYFSIDSVTAQPAAQAKGNLLDFISSAASAGGNIYDLVKDVAAVGATASVSDQILGTLSGLALVTSSILDLSDRIGRINEADNPARAPFAELVDIDAQVTLGLGVESAIDLSILGAPATFGIAPIVAFFAGTVATYEYTRYAPLIRYEAEKLYNLLYGTSGFDPGDGDPAPISLFGIQGPKLINGGSPNGGTDSSALTSLAMASQVEPAFSGATPSPDSIVAGTGQSGAAGANGATAGQAGGAGSAGGPGTAANTTSSDAANSRSWRKRGRRSGWWSSHGHHGHNRWFTNWNHGDRHGYRRRRWLQRRRRAGRAHCIWKQWRRGWESHGFGHRPERGGRGERHDHSLWRGRRNGRWHREQRRRGRFGPGHRECDDCGRIRRCRHRTPGWG